MAASPMRIRLIVAALLLLALGLRIAEVQRTPSYRPFNDSESYLVLGHQVAETGDYSTSHAPGSGAYNTIGPSAYFPPAFPYFLAFVDRLDGHVTAGQAAVHSARLAVAVLGTVGAGLIGLVAFEAFGSTVGLIALAIAAVYPVLIELSSTIYSENLLIVFALAAVWAALRARRSDRPYRWIVAAGLLAGLATLTHQNGAVVALALLPLVWTARRTLAAPALLVGVAVLTVAPWTIRNAIMLHRFIPVSDETGITLAGTYNPNSAADHQIPYRWIDFGHVPAYEHFARQAPHLTEPALNAKLQSAALHYIGDHPSAPLAAAYHNTRRLLELEGSYAWRVSAASIGISEGIARLGVIGFWLVLLAAVAGACTRLARRAPGWLWAVPVLYYLSIVFVNAETPRFRAPIDPFLIMLASCAIATAWSRAAPSLRRQPLRQEPATSVRR